MACRPRCFVRLLLALIAVSVGILTYALWTIGRYRATWQQEMAALAMLNSPHNEDVLVDDIETKDIGPRWLRYVSADPIGERVAGLCVWHHGSRVSLAPLARLTELKRLVIKNECTATQFQQVCELVGLEELVFRQIDLADEQMVGLAALKELKHLTLIYSVANESPVNFLQHLRSLEDLRIFSRGISDDALSSLGDVRGLRTLYLTGSENIHAAGLKHLDRLPFLSCLVLGGAKIGDSELACVASFPNLEYLSFYGIGQFSSVCTISSKSMGQLRRLANLRTLELPSVTADQIHSLVGAASLQTLVLTDCRMTTDLCVAIAQLEGLRYLELDNCEALTDEQLNRLKATGMRVTVFNGVID